MASVRCHMAVVNGRRCRNVIVTYSGETVPSDRGLDVGKCECSVREFTGECHSTVDFNGVAVIENSFFEVYTVKQLSWLRLNASAFLL